MPAKCPDQTMKAPAIAGVAERRKDGILPRANRTSRHRLGHAQEHGSCQRAGGMPVRHSHIGSGRNMCATDIE